ncbi:MAG TPA: glycosyltransferase family 1 protein [Acidimicrobiales bacterium]|nr:glycosyltransferase family 1 protein [Acidimicrobiales bacterium]
MLTVAVDATPLVGDRTGIGKAVSGLIRELASRPDLSLIGYGLTMRGWRNVRGALPPGARPSRGPMPAGPLLDVWGRSDLAPVEWWTGSVDVVHGTNYVVPPAKHASRLVSVWDLTAVHYPQLCTPTSRKYPGLIGRAVREGAWVHTGASSVAAEIVDHFGADPSRVRVIAPGIEPASDGSPGVPPRPSGPPYILGLGTTEPRKDFPNLVAAFDRIASRHPDLELRIAGPEGWGESQVRSAVDASPHAGRIKRLGWIADTRGLIAGAAVFAFPSIYEGFGYPPLEAMSLGVPVVATSAGAVPEIAGDAALLVKPGDPDALAGALSCVLDNGDVRAQLVEKGKARAARFSWDAAASAMQDLYAEIAGKR